MSDDPVLAALARFEAGQTKLRVDVMERIDRLQQTVDLVRDDIGVNYAATDRAERLAQTALDDGRSLATIVRIMQRQIARLQTNVEELRGPPAS